MLEAMFSAKHPVKILMVDDWSDHRAIAERLLKESGVEHDFKFFISPVYAWDYLLELSNDPQARLPDLILLDTILPGHSSWSFLRGLRNDHKLRDMTVIMMQANRLDLTFNYQTAEEAAFANGANGFIETPISYKKLLALLTKLLI